MKTLPRSALPWSLVLAILVYGLTLIFALATTQAHAAPVPRPFVPPHTSEPPLLNPRTPVVLTPAVLKQLAAIYQTRATALRLSGDESEARYYDGLAGGFLFLAAAIEEGLIVLPIVSQNAPATPAEP